MTRIPTRINVDPYYDGEGGQTTGPHLPPHADQPAPPATVSQAPPGYHDARQVALESGRPVTSVMRAGPHGLAGTVIPHANQGGIPSGTHPHAMSNMEVTVDPHIVGQEAHVRLGDITRASLDAAEQMAREVTPDPYSVETSRMRASAVMQGVAITAGGGAATVPAYNPAPPVAPAPAPVPAPAPPTYIAAPNLGRAAGAQPAQPAPTRQVRPLQAFNDASQVHHEGHELRPIDMTPETPREYGAVQPPQFHVTFEIEHFGLHKANYHDVLIGPGFLVLVYADGYQGGEMYVPPSADDTPSMALHVEGADQVHLVHTTGFMYSYGGHTFCILLIERSGPAEEITQ